jgi:succinate dehydrogenase/fumarate reductase flavoprotein subunit
LNEYNEAAKTKNDKYGKKYFINTPFEYNDNVFHVAEITPVVHYTLGGVKIDAEGRVCGK